MICRTKPSNPSPISTAMTYPKMSIVVRNNERGFFLRIAQILKCKNQIIGMTGMSFHTRSIKQV